MGRSTTKKPKGAPDRAHVGDSATDQREAGGGAGPAGANDEEELLEQEVLTVLLVQVNATTLAATNVGDPVQVSGKRVMVQAGHLGNIPPGLVDTVSSGGYRRGHVSNTEPATVQLRN